MNDLPPLPEPRSTRPTFVGIHINASECHGFTPIAQEELPRFSELDLVGYARAAVLAERQACWDAINAHIKDGPLPGNGWDQQAQRNGLVLASNILSSRDAAIRGQGTG